MKPIARFRRQDHLFDFIARRVQALLSGPSERA